MRRHDCDVDVAAVRRSGCAAHKVWITAGCLRAGHHAARLGRHERAVTAQHEPLPATTLEHLGAVLGHTGEATGAHRAACPVAGQRRERVRRVEREPGDLVDRHGDLPVLDLGELVEDGPQTARLHSDRRCAILRDRVDPLLGGVGARCLHRDVGVGLLAGELSELGDGLVIVERDGDLRLGAC